jgi:hypothetical protein
MKVRDYLVDFRKLETDLFVDFIQRQYKGNYCPKVT